VGDNTFHGPVTVTGFPATPGWDAATGLGSPQANRLVPVLAGRLSSLARHEREREREHGRS
jgi:hypothetical protein